MDINQLNCFISVAQTLNFSEAARRNYVSQSTVSRYISEIEKEFGAQLFTRSHRDVFLTNEGKALLPYAIEIVDTMKKAATIIKQMHDGGNGRLTVACDVTSFSFPVKCITSFSEKYPDITIDLKQIDGAGRSEVMTGGEYDFYFMPRDMLPESPGIETIVTHSEPLYVVVNKNSHIARRKSISFTQLSNEKFVLLSETVSPILYMEIMDLFRTFHIEPDVANTFDDAKSMYVAVNSGIGMSIVPESLASFAVSSNTAAVPVSDADTSIVYVMAWSRNLSNPAARLFIETAKQFSHGDDNIYGL